jgi:hypothetical protein
MEVFEVDRSAHVVVRLPRALEGFSLNTGTRGQGTKLFQAKRIC